jgi:hypothetical protein
MLSQKRLRDPAETIKIRSVSHEQALPRSRAVCYWIDGLGLPDSDTKDSSEPPSESSKESILSIKPFFKYLTI